MNIHSGMAPTDKREAILRAALDLFVERGFHGTAVPAVAELAEVGAGTIYRYFASKEALVNAVYQANKAALGEHVLSRFPLDRPPREQFHAFWQRMSEWVRAHPRAFAFLELHHHASYLDDDSRAVESKLMEFAVQFVVQAQAQQALRAANPMLLMTLVYGAFVGVVRASWEGKIALDDANLATAEQCTWEAIRA